MKALVVSLGFFVVAVLPPVLGAQCACATTNVHVRDGAGITHNILTTLSTHHCLTFKGNRHNVDGASWVHVDYHGKDGWIHEGYVQIKACDTNAHPVVNSHVQLPGCPKIVTRAEWGARTPTHPLQPLPATTPHYMFIHHGASAGCHTKADCIHRVQQYQNYHMDGHGWSDIGYSFVVGEDGNVYEARGWDHVGAHTKGYNSVGLAICVIGNFMDHLPNQAALTAVKQMVQCAKDNHKIDANYSLLGHRDVGATACPGDQLYGLIKTWTHYGKH